MKWGKKKDDSRQQTLSPDSADDKFVKGHASEHYTHVLVL